MGFKMILDEKLEMEQQLISELYLKVVSGDYHLEVDDEHITFRKVHKIKGKFAGFEDKIEYYTQGELSMLESNKLELEKLRSIINGR